MIAGHRRLLLPVLLSAVSCVGAACASTTYETGDDSTPSADTVDAPTTTALTGTAAELLPALAEEAAGLSAVMIADGDEQAVVARVESLWDAARKEIAATRPELLADFDANVRRCADAARFRRAADADKAAANLGALVAAYLG